MKFTPKTDDQIVEDSLWPEGEYDFEVAYAEDKVSKNDNEMIALKIFVYNGAAESRSVFDYFLESMAFKLRHPAYACGLGQEYEGGSLTAENFSGKSGKLYLT